MGLNEKEMIKKFLSYYKPHIKLFWLDTFVAIASSVLSIIFPYITREIMKTYIPNKDWNIIILSLILLFAIFVFQALFNYVRVRWGHIMGVRIETDMRMDLFNHLQRLSFSYFDKTKTGNLMSRITNDLFMISEVAHHGPEDFIISVITIIGAYILMFSFSSELAVISLIPIPIMVFYGIVFGDRLKNKFRVVRKKVADVNSQVENSIQGIREVKSFTSEDFESKRFSNFNFFLKNAKSDQYKVMASYHCTLGFFRDMYYFVTVAGGAILLYRGIIHSYDLVAFLLYISIVLSPIDRLINFVEQLNQGMASFERFVEIMEIEPDIKDKESAKNLEVREGNIVYDNIRFSYDSEEGEVVGDVSLKIKGGSKVAFVGESGAGKTTLASLLPRFYEINSGNILIDNQNIQDVTQRSLRQSIGFVQQNVFLFDSTIRENLLYGNPNASEEDLLRAIEAANLKEFIETLPDGLDTLVGEHGARLSGGQKQRISIARVFLKDPSILIFDEATSSLDTDSEAQIQEAFDRLSRGRTCITIAHRLTTIKQADEIFVVKNGHIVERGKHDDLIALGGVYAKLYKRQG